MKKAKAATSKRRTTKPGGTKAGRFKPSWLWHRLRLRYKLLTIFLVIVLLVLGSMYGIAQWYIHKHQNDPLKIGVTFIPSYARYYELDPQETMDALINDLGFRRFRLVSYWDKFEVEPGQYDFSELDWQFQKVQDAGGKVVLTLGLRQPRWPECHMPSWAKHTPKEQWYPELKKYMTAVVERYKNHPNLEGYQLENEFFLEVFGECPDFSRERLVDEFNLVKELDPHHPITVSRSNNATPSWPLGAPRADEVGASIYKRVWDRTVTKRYFEYPFPAWFYAFLAGATELTTGRNTIIHEMQTEAWPPDGIKNASIEEQNKSFDAGRMHSRLEFGLATGMRTMDLWGAEWWYWRKVHLNDPSLWEAAKTELQRLDVSRNY